MDVKIYWGRDYFYSVPTDGEYEYMPYTVYLMIKNKQRGFAALPTRAPIIRDKKIKNFSMEIIDVLRVERLNDNLFVLEEPSQKYTITDGLISSHVSSKALRFLKERTNFDYLRIVANYNNTNATCIFSEGNKLIAIYDDLFLDIDPKTNKLKNGTEKKTFAVIIDFDKNPTVESIYEVTHEKIVYHGKRYVDFVPLYSGIKFYSNRVSGLVEGDYIVRVKGKKVEIIDKVPTIDSALWNLLRANVKRSSAPVGLERPGVIEYKYNSLIGTVFAIVRWGDRVYTVVAPVNAYVTGSMKWLIKTFGKEAPLKLQGGRLCVDYESVEKSNKVRAQKKYKILGVEFKDYGYALVGELNGKEIILPLIENSIPSKKKVYAMPMNVYRFIQGDDSAEVAEAFFINKYRVVMDPTNFLTTYSSEKVMGAAVLDYRGFIIPGVKEIRRFVSKYGDHIKDVQYIPDKDDYKLYIDFGSFGLLYSRYGIEEMHLQHGSMLLALKKDFETVWNIEASEKIEGNYFFDEKEYFKVIVDGNSVKLKLFKNYKKEEDDGTVIYFPLKRPEVTYYNCGLYLTINGRPVRRLVDMCIPNKIKVTGVNVEDEPKRYVISGIVEGSGDKVTITAYEDAFELCVGEHCFEFENTNDLYGALEVLARGGVPSLLALM